MNLSVTPIGGWLVWASASFLVLFLSYLAYRERIQVGSARKGPARLAFGLRMAALALTLFAALRPSLVMTVKRERPAMLLFQIDKSRSMTLSDQAAGRSRWDVASELMQEVAEEIERIGPPLEATFQAFDTAVSDFAPDKPPQPDGGETALGAALADGPARLGSGRVAAIYVLSDGASNQGTPPMTAAANLRALRVPVNVVTFGSSLPEEGMRDIAVKDFVAGPTVYVKNQLQVRATVTALGFAGRKLTAQLFEEDKPDPVASMQFDAPENGAPFALKDLSYIPETPGETKLTLRIVPQDGEVTNTNNETGTYVNVLKGGLNVLYVQGPAFSWEYRFLARALDASPDIRVDLVVLRKPASLSEGDLDDKLLEPGKYDVFILDTPVSVLTPPQIQKLAANVQRGAGLLMLGGRLSFSGGGWSNTPVAGILPVDVPLGMPQNEPEGGLRIVPTNAASESYVTRLSADPAESDRIWRALPPIPGAHQFGAVKPNAAILLETEDKKPLLVSQDLGRGRTLAFAGETWVWPRGSVTPGASQDSALAHRRFWRQTILWLARKENQDEKPITLALDQRRIARGGRLEFSASARDPKGDPIAGVTFRARVERIEKSAVPEAPDEDAATKAAESPNMFVQGSSAQGNYVARGTGGEFRLTVEGLVNGQPIGAESARFLVSQEDRELEQPTADPSLLAAIAATTGGKVLTPENLVKELSSIDLRQFSEFESQEEFRMWDNWPMFLAFLGVLSAEWIVRRKSGMV
jgi:uncharacterized membrane protein